MPSVLSTDRRRLLTWLIGAIATAIAGTAGAIFGRFLGASPRAREPGEAVAISLGKASDGEFVAGPREKTVSFVEQDGYFRENRRTRIYLTRIGSEPAVFSATCTHLGCAVAWDPGSLTFRCPCHGGVYRSDGTVAGGPPPRPLRRLPIEIRDGEVFIRPQDLA